MTDGSDSGDMSTDEALRKMDEMGQDAFEEHGTQDENPKPGSSEGERPLLWVSLTSTGRGQHDEESMAELRDYLEDDLGDRYDIVVADDRVRLLSREEALEAIQDLQQVAQQQAHEDALFEAATEGDGDGE